MKSKRTLQVLMVFMLVFSTMIGSQPALASTNSMPANDAMVIDRSLSYWDATYVGFVNSGINEKWHFDFTEAHNFVVTVSPISGDLVPHLILMDASGNALASGTGSVTSVQSAGTYAIQVEPESGGGFYILTLRENAVPVGPSSTTVVSPSSVNVGDTATVLVSLDNVPASGYTSAEFACSYDPSLVQTSSVVVGGLFGADAAAAINDPQNGSFIVAIAGSNGNKATTSGPVFSFAAKALQAGSASVQCAVRVSTGNNTLSSITSTGSTLTITGTAPTATTTPTPVESPTVVPTEPSETPVVTSTPEPGVTPTETSTLEPGVTPTETSTLEPGVTPTDTPIESETPTVEPTLEVTATPIESATPTPIEETPTFTPTPVEPTATPLPDGTVTGQVVSGKSVAVGLYTSEGVLVTSVVAGEDGTFLLTAPAGTYTIAAVSRGYLSAQGSVTLVGGSTVTQPTVTLVAGDIDNNNVIDQFDAITIGINYNASAPDSADLNNDGVINVLDLEILAQNYRETGPLAW